MKKKMILLPGISSWKSFVTFPPSFSTSTVYFPESEFLRSPMKKRFDLPILVTTARPMSSSFPFLKNVKLASSGTSNLSSRSPPALPLTTPVSGKSTLTVGRSFLAMKEKNK